MRTRLPPPPPDTCAALPASVDGRFSFVFSPYGSDVVVEVAASAAAGAANRQAVTAAAAAAWMRCKLIEGR